MGRRRRVFIGALIAVVIIVLGFAVRFVAFPRSDPIGQTDLVVALDARGDYNKIMVIRKVLAENPHSTLLYSGDSGCPSELNTFARQVVCFFPHPNTTQGEARYAANYGRTHHANAITVVVPRPQLGRARIRFSRCWHGQLSMVESPTSLWGAIEQVPYQTLATVKAEVLQRSC